MNGPSACNSSRFERNIARCGQTDAGLDKALEDKDESLYSKVSEETRKKRELTITNNIRQLTNETKALLVKNWVQIDSMVKELIAKETLYYKDIKKIIVSRNNNTKEE